MRISYSGIDLEVVRLVHFDRTPVLSEDGVDYLFTKFTIAAIGLVSSDQLVSTLRSNQQDTIGMSYRGAEGFAILAAGPVRVGLPAGVRHTPESTPIRTDVAIRHWLSVPRRQLLITNENGTQELLRTPKNGFIVDAHNGPIPEVYSVEQVMGDAKLFMVGLQIVSYVNECEDNGQGANAFLSNRFSQNHDIDEDGFITIQTVGQARFRTDLVYGNMNPDATRPFLFLPIPNGFKRENIKVEGIPDVSGFNYSFIDRQMPQQLVVGDIVGATRVEATYRQVFATNEDSLGTILQGLERVTSTLLNRKWLKDKAPDHPAVAPTPGVPPTTPKLGSRIKGGRR